MTPFFGVSYEEGRNGGLPQGNTKSIFVKANRRFCLPLYDPREYVIPNPFSRHCLKLLKDIK